jgi:hypothetical protein
VRHRAVCVGLVGLLVAGCGATRHVSGAPFVAEGGESSGPSSGLWGDSGSGPSGMHVGCIDGRRFAVLITVRNRSKREVTLQAAGGSEDVARVLRRAAVQVHLAPPPPTGDLAVTGLRGWNGQDSRPAAIPAGREAWVQSNFLMGDCRSLRPGERVIANRSTMLAYRVGGSAGSQVVSVRGARMILTRGPLDPSLPINQVG